MLIRITIEQTCFSNDVLMLHFDYFNQNIIT